MKELLDDISSAVQRIYKEAVDPVEEKFAYEKRPSEGEISGPPTVLILGNHSSGKSTFINHLLAAEVQKTGLAPTDDAFTILAYGDKDEEFEGKAVASNPDLPYAGLKHFGDGLLSHSVVRRRRLGLASYTACPAGRHGPRPGRGRRRGRTLQRPRCDGRRR